MSKLSDRTLSAIAFFELAYNEVYLDILALRYEYFKVLLHNFAAISVLRQWSCLILVTALTSVTHNRVLQNLPMCKITNRYIEILTRTDQCILNVQTEVCIFLI